MGGFAVSFVMLCLSPFRQLYPHLLPNTDWTKSAVILINDRFPVASSGLTSSICLRPAPPLCTRWNTQGSAIIGTPNPVIPWSLELLAPQLLYRMIGTPNAVVQWAPELLAPLTL